jgi:WASH complex subunit strumpellin
VPFNLNKWFHDIAREIDSLDCSASAVASGRKMQQLKQALEEVEQFHQLEQSLQVRQFLADVRKYLEQMLRVVNVGPSVLAILDLVSDLSYGWDILRDAATGGYVALLQQRIKDAPVLVLKLRSTLVKLSSILNVPLVRINQANSPDLMSVSAYYSDELVAYVRRVLEVIPKTVFELLNAIIEL